MKSLKKKYDDLDLKTKKAFQQFAFTISQLYNLEKDQYGEYTVEGVDQQDGLFVYALVLDKSVFDMNVRRKEFDSIMSLFPQRIKNFVFYYSTIVQGEREFDADQFYLPRLYFTVYRITLWDNIKKLFRRNGGRKDNSKSNGRLA